MGWTLSNTFLWKCKPSCQWSLTHSPQCAEDTVRNETTSQILSARLLSERCSTVGLQAQATMGSEKPLIGGPGPSLLSRPKLAWWAPRGDYRVSGRKKSNAIWSAQCEMRRRCWSQVPHLFRNLLDVQPLVSITPTWDVLNNNLL